MKYVEIGITAITRAVLTYEGQTTLGEILEVAKKKNVPVSEEFINELLRRRARGEAKDILTDILGHRVNGVATPTHPELFGKGRKTTSFEKWFAAQLRFIAQNELKLESAKSGIPLEEGRHAHLPEPKQRQGHGPTALGELLFKAALKAGLGLEVKKLLEGEEVSLSEMQLASLREALASMGWSKNDFVLD